MPKHQIFLVHGMGEFTAGWSKPVADFLLKQYQRYDLLKKLKFEEHFEFQEVLYNDFFDGLREKWKKKREAVLQEMAGNGLSGGTVGKLADIASATEGDNFLRTHVLDVLLYRFFPSIGEKVRVQVMKQIQQKLDSLKEGAFPEYTIIAHSLGTAVIQESLHQWMSDPKWPGKVFASQYRPANLVMIANVSRALWSLGGNFYASDVRPFSLKTQGACTWYGSFAHDLDPFTHVKPFDAPPSNWFFPGSAPADLYSGVPLPSTDITEINVHGLTHYLGNPLVHVPIFRKLSGAPLLVQQQEMEEKLAQYRQGTLGGSALKDARMKLTTFTLSETESWSGILDSIVRFRGEVLEDGPGKHEGEDL
jgi:hypothetical protein